jgi:hypothetical protein
MGRARKNERAKWAKMVGVRQHAMDMGSVHRACTRWLRERGLEGPTMREQVTTGFYRRGKKGADPTVEAAARELESGWPG